jgi:hypothetical protein
MKHQCMQVASAHQKKDVELHDMIDDLVDDMVRASVGPKTPEEREADLKEVFCQVRLRYQDSLHRLANYRSAKY